MWQFWTEESHSKDVSSPKLIRRVNAMLSMPTVEFVLQIYTATLTIYMESKASRRELKTTLRSSELEESISSVLRLPGGCSNHGLVVQTHSSTEHQTPETCPPFDKRGKAVSRRAANNRC